MHALPGRAHAQAAAPASDDAKRNEAREHYRRGLELFRKREVDAAIAEFLESRRIFATRAATVNAALALKDASRFGEAADMLALAQSFDATPDERATVKRELDEMETRVGRITVTVTEPAATLTIDGRDYGKSPLDAPVHLAPGTHIVRAYKSGFAPAENTLNVTAGGKADASLSLVALERSGRLAIAEVEGKVADVIVDNVNVGKTPYQGSFAPGEHAVYLRGEGQLGTQPALAPVRINEVMSMTLALDTIDSKWRITPTPADATLLVDGVRIGRGTWEGRLRAGAHLVEAQHEGYLSQSRRVTTASGGSEDVRIALERDLDSPMFKKPNRVFAEVAGSAPFALAPGGAAHAACNDGCSHDVPWGIAIGARVGLQMGNGLGLALDASYAYGVLGGDGREATLVVNGAAPVRATIDERLRYRVLALGAAVHYRIGDTFPVVTARLGSGVWTGTMASVRSGVVSGTSAALPAQRSEPDPTVTAVYVQPEVRLGAFVADRFEAYVGVNSSVLVTLDRPAYANEKSFAVPTGFARYENETLLGGIAWLIGPCLGVKYDF